MADTGVDTNCFTHDDKVPLPVRFAQAVTGRQSSQAAHRMLFLCVLSVLYMHIFSVFLCVWASGIVYLSLSLCGSVSVCMFVC